MNDTAQMLITVLLALLGIATTFYLWADAAKEAKQRESSARNRKPDDTAKVYIYPTDRKSS